MLSLFLKEDRRTKTHYRDLLNLKLNKKLFISIFFAILASMIFTSLLAFNEKS